MNKSLTEMGRERINHIKKWIRKNAYGCINNQMCRESAAKNLIKLVDKVSKESFRWASS